MAKVDLRLDWCSHEAAKYAVEKWHYSHITPHSKIVKIGVWEDKFFVGVVIFGVGATNNLCKPYGLKNTEGCELVRIALKDHVTPVTKIVSIAIHMLKRSNPKLRLIVSFADPSQGHHGGIYQAGNWIYTGLSGGGTEYHWRGKWVHSRSIGNYSKKVGMNRALLADDQRESVKKHRYLYPLDDAMRKQIEPLRKPYPKRADKATQSATGDQPENGGAIPTYPLMKVEDNG